MPLIVSYSKNMVSSVRFQEYDEQNLKPEH